MFVRHRWPQGIHWWYFSWFPRENAAADYKCGHSQNKAHKLQLLHRGVLHARHHSRIISRSAYQVLRGCNGRSRSLPAVVSDGESTPLALLDFRCGRSEQADRCPKAPGYHIRIYVRGVIQSTGPLRYAADNLIGSTIDGSSFSGLFTRVEIGHIRIGSAGNGTINSRGSGRH
jgi:hypothetical protein